MTMRNPYGFPETERDWERALAERQARRARYTRHNWVEGDLISAPGLTAQTSQDFHVVVGAKPAGEAEAYRGLSVRLVGLLTTGASGATPGRPDYGATGTIIMALHKTTPDLSGSDYGLTIEALSASTGESYENTRRWPFIRRGLVTAYPTVHTLYRRHGFVLKPGEGIGVTVRWMTGYNLASGTQLRYTLLVTARREAIADTN